MRCGHTTTEEGFEAALAMLARERLTAKQKRILPYLRTHDAQVCATHAVKELGRAMRCSRSTVWNCLAVLRRAGLVAYSQGSSHQQPIRLTLAGTHVAQRLSVQEVPSAGPHEARQHRGGRETWQQG